MPKQTTDASTIIRVDRTVRPEYPDWMLKVLRPELEEIGPEEYDLTDVEQWLDVQQKHHRKTIQAELLYTEYYEELSLEICLGLRDLEEIQKKGPSVYDRHFRIRGALAWKSVVQSKDGSFHCPYLFSSGAFLSLHWMNLKQEMDASIASFRFKKNA